ncbi:endospore germination permease [Bacillus sp. NTK074B]|uniref:GerAB/ArcD/ProY family transporter n=1 Tax=Bacillus sp. NTK074B TaxID=2802174 RepID=UPI001A8CB8A4|nr:endospore germination permease [Bacillus sp. NTK074B]
MNKESISLLELCTMMLLFLIGSTVVVGLNFSAMEDSFWAILIEMGFGTLLFYSYLILLKRSEWKEFVPLLEMGFGSVFSKVLAVLFSFYFLYIAARVMNDFAFFTTQVLFPDAPNWIASIPFLIVIGYCIILGFEAIARSAVILSFFSIVTLVALWLLGFFSAEFQGRFLMPLFSHGWKPLWKMIFPIGLTFPYGELVVFLVFIPLTVKKGQLITFAWIPIVLAGLIIIVTMELVIGILHAPFANTYYFPFVKAMEMISYLGVLEHLEIFTYLLLIGGGFIKISVFIYAARIVLTQLFTMKHKNWHVLLLLSIVYILSLHRSRDIEEHLYVGLNLVPYYLHIPFQFILPFLLGVVVFWKTRKRA